MSLSPVQVRALLAWLKDAPRPLHEMEERAIALCEEWLEGPEHPLMRDASKLPSAYDKETRAPYRCGAFEFPSQRQCVLHSDHGSPHAIEGTEAALIVEYFGASLAEPRFTIKPGHRDRR